MDWNDKWWLNLWVSYSFLTSDSMSLWGLTAVSIIHCDWCQWDHIDPQCCFYYSLGSAEGFITYTVLPLNIHSHKLQAFKCPFRVRMSDIKHYLSYGLNFVRSQRRHGRTGNGLLDMMRMNRQCLWAMHWVCLAHSIRMHSCTFLFSVSILWHSADWRKCERGEYLSCGLKYTPDSPAALPFYELKCIGISLLVLNKNVLVLALYNSVLWEAK